MIISVFVLALFSYIFSKQLPYIYNFQKRRAIASCVELAKEDEQVNIYPFISFVIFILPAFILYFTSDILMPLFAFIFAIAAYTDVSKRWIPDFIIYLMLAVSIYSLQSKNLFESIIASIFYLMPVVLLSLYGFISKKENWIASGDFYIFPSIGLMLAPEYSAGVMLATLTIMLILMHWTEKIPLVTVAYFTFIGFNLCSYSGYL